MLKLFKTIIKGNVGTETYERDAKHRMTMGYDTVSNVIKVKVEEVIPPNPDLDEELPEDTATVLRDPHTTADFKVVAERDFTEADFVMKSDNYKWIVEYDSSTKTISDPIDVYEISKQYVTNSVSHEKIYYNLNEYRYQTTSTLTPLFVLDSYFKEAAGFEWSTLCFFVEDLSLDVMDTIIENPADTVQLVSPKEYEFWCQYNNRTAAVFEVLDADGKVLSSAFQSLKPAEKAAGFVPLTQVRPPDLSDVSPSLNIPETPLSGNRFFVKLPAADTFNIRVMFGNRVHNIIGTRPSVTFDVQCVNAVSNKTRIVSKYDPADPNVYVQEFIEKHNHPADKMTTVFAGADGLVVQTPGLVTGDYFKVKLNLGQFTSWAELWVEIA